jgi:signal transduction histidine kinase
VVSPPAAVLGLPASLALGGRRIRNGALLMAIVALAAVSAVLAATSGHVQHPTATALYYGYLVAASLLAAVCWHVRRPSSSFGLLLAAFGLSAWAISWQSSDWPLPFDLAVLADAVYFTLTYYLFLAFPSGRLETWVNRGLIAACGVVAAAFFVPWALLSPGIAGGGPLSVCVPACPRNVLQVGTNLSAVEFLGRWETYTMLAITVAVLAVYWHRVTRASRPMRRALFAVASSSLLFLPVFFVYHFSREVLGADPATLAVMGWVLVGMRVVLPLGFLVALFQAELFAGAARGRLLEQLLMHPSPQQWRDAIATAVDDPSVELAFWDPVASRHRRPDGRELDPPLPGIGRSWVTAERDGRPVAAMVLDDALAGDPELVRAATSATVLAVENGALEGELRSSRARIIEAGDAERRRIERDIHDSAQQRLVALRINLALTGEHLQGHDQRAAVDRLGRDVEEAIDDLRNVAGGVYPAALTDRGAVAALRAAGRNAALPVTVEDRGIGRHAPQIEATVYFCCLEALQNAAKHAGAGASATVWLARADGGVAFGVEDDGGGFSHDTVQRGHGLTNIADRLSASGGTLALDSARGRGTRLSGWIPTRAAAAMAPDA